MRIDSWDKLKLWREALILVAETVDFGTLNLMQSSTYLDRLEQRTAWVGCKSWTVLETLQRKALWKPMEAALTELCEVPVSVKFTHGRPRIVEKPHEPVYTAVKPMDYCTPEEYELQSLHAEYGDIIGIVDGHPVFRRAIAPIENGGWGIFKRVLTRRCKDYGVMAVLEGLRHVAGMPDVDRPRAYFLKELERGRWGHKLVITPSITGPQLQAV